MCIEKSYFLSTYTNENDQWSYIKYIINYSLNLGEPCHPYEPFKCPGNGACISIQYLCDGAPDCPDGYDEDARLCTAGNIIHMHITLIN